MVNLNLCLFEEKGRNRKVFDKHHFAGVLLNLRNNHFGVLRLVLATPGTRLVLVLEGQCTRSKKAPSTRVHLTFARSNKLTNKMNFR